MSRKLIIATFLAIALAGGALLAAPGAPMSQAGRPEHGRRGGNHLSPAQLAEFLGLSAEQKSKAQALHEEQRSATEPLRRDLRTNRETVKSAVDAGNALEAGQALIAAKGLREQLKAAHEGFESKFEAILTPEQKARWSVLQDLRKTRRGERERGGDE
jgi:Spy/CpxP family protein refolding chaperone